MRVPAIGAESVGAEAPPTRAKTPKRRIARLLREGFGPDAFGADRPRTHRDRIGKHRG
ncbi:DUF6053 domain-containing protein [Lysobacter enzymogenes]|uniref:DUF6053 domain-containing protein n=1 Tax=Lysobacter enzymogenes TaxID=69 RepID=UPI003D189698